MDNGSRLLCLLPPLYGCVLRMFQQKSCKCSVFVEREDLEIDICFQVSSSSGKKKVYHSVALVETCKLLLASGETNTSFEAKDTKFMPCKAS